MKWILLIIVTMSHQNDGRTPVAVDHIEFTTQAGCEDYRKALLSAPASKSGGLMGVVNVVNGAINGPIIDARPCAGVNDAAAE